MGDATVGNLVVGAQGVGILVQGAPQTPTCTLPSHEDIGFVGRTAELATLDAWGESDRRVMVVHGAPGVGKTRLAIEWAHRHPELFPGGRYFLSFRGDPYEQLHEVARLRGVRREPDERLDQWAIRTLHHLGAERALVVLDDLQSPDEFKVWFGRLSLARALVVTNERVWPAGYAKLPVDVLVPDDARALVRQVIDNPTVAATHAERIVARTGGNAVQLVVDAGAVHDAAELGETPSLPPLPAPEAVESFEWGWRAATEDARTLVCALALYRAQSTPLARVVEVLAADGWTEERARTATSAAVRRHLATRNENGALTLHPLLRTFTRVRGATVLSDTMRSAHARAFVARAQEFARGSGDRALYAELAHDEFEQGVWSNRSEPLSSDDCYWIGEALREAGCFAEACSWHKQAAAEKYHDNAKGCVDHNSIGSSLHRVGLCMLSQGNFAEAQGWFERAVVEIRQGDTYNRIDHDMLGTSLHCLGNCLLSQDNIAEARKLFEQAVEETRQGDVGGHVNHELLGVSLNQAAYCLTKQHEFEQALDWYKNAVDEVLHGDANGRINHDTVGSMWYSIGFCLSSLGRIEQARAWYEKAVEEARHGDTRGRINHEMLGLILDQVGLGLANQGHFAEAYGWHEKATAEKHQGDLFNRINHTSLGMSLHEMAHCLANQRRFAEATECFEQAAAEKCQGDIHGQIDNESLGSSLHFMGGCLCMQGKFAEALGLYKKAASAKRLGDVFGYIDASSLALTLECLAGVLDHLNLPDEARDAREEAARLRASKR